MTHNYHSDRACSHLPSAPAVSLTHLAHMTNDKITLNLRPLTKTWLPIAHTLPTVLKAGIHLAKLHETKQTYSQSNLFWPFKATFYTVTLCRWLNTHILVWLSEQKTFDITVGAPEILCCCTFSEHIKTLKCETLFTEKNRCYLWCIIKGWLLGLYFKHESKWLVWIPKADNICAQLLRKQCLGIHAKMGKYSTIVKQCMNLLAWWKQQWTPGFFYTISTCLHCISQSWKGADS